MLTIDQMEMMLVGHLKEPDVRCHRTSPLNFCSRGCAARKRALWRMRTAGLRIAGPHSCDTRCSPCPARTRVCIGVLLSKQRRHTDWPARLGSEFITPKNPLKSQGSCHRCPRPVQANSASASAQLLVLQGLAARGTPWTYAQSEITRSQGCL